MNPDAITALVQEIAAKHSITVGRDDPILVLHTLNERLIRDSAHAHEQMVANLKEEFEGVAALWEQEAKSKAERILNASLAAARESMEQTAKKTSEAVSRSLRQEFEGVYSHIETQLGHSRRVASVNLLAACTTLAAAALAIAGRLL